MSSATTEELNNSGLEFVAASMLLHNREGRRESVVEHAKKRLNQSGALLQENGFLPHLSKNVPSSVDQSDYLTVLGRGC